MTSEGNANSKDSLKASKMEGKVCMATVRNSSFSIHKFIFYFYSLLECKIDKFLPDELCNLERFYQCLNSSTQRGIFEAISTSYESNRLKEEYLFVIKYILRPTFRGRFQKVLRVLFHVIRWKIIAT